MRPAAAPAPAPAPPAAAEGLSGLALMLEPLDLLPIMIDPDLRSGVIGATGGTKAASGTVALALSGTTTAAATLEELTALLAGTAEEEEEAEEAVVVAAEAEEEEESCFVGFWLSAVSFSRAAAAADVAEVLVVEGVCGEETVVEVEEEEEEDEDAEVKRSASSPGAIERRSSAARLILSRSPLLDLGVEGP